jgi:hypothetical protein
VPDLPTLARLAPSSPELLEQLSEGRTVAGRLLGRPPVPDWIYVEGGRLDMLTLDQLQLGRYGEHVAGVSAASSAPLSDADNAGCPDPALSFACPVSIETTSGAVSTGYISDEGLGERLALLPSGGGNDRLAIQHFFAETSMIREELPGTEGRVVQATIPANWNPTPRLSRILFEGIHDAPWLRSVTPAEGLEGSPEPASRQLQDELPPGEAELPEDFFESDLIPAKELIASYASVAVEDTARTRRLRHNLLVAESRFWFGDVATAAGYVQSSLDEAEAELSKIKIIGVDDVTLTSSKGKFQLVLANGTNTPVKVAVNLEADQLEVDPDLLERLSTTYGPGNHPLTITATARTSGKFSAAITVESLDGHLISQKDIEIRSTAYNRIALGITLGALLFLVLFYLFRLFRRSRSRNEPQADPA